MTKKTLALTAFILLKFLLQYLMVDPVYDLQRDEYLHLDLGRHLAWGYQSVPPATAWTSVIIRLLGNGEFWVRFFPALYGVLTLVVVWKTITSLGGSWWALVIGATGVLLSSLLRLNMLYQPNSLDILCWTALYFTLVRYMMTGRPKWLYACAVVFALGFMNKYNIVFLLVGVFPAILLTAQRKMLGRKELYLAALLALVLIAPNLLWQYHNGFPVVHHMKELAERQLVHVDRAGFFRAQLFFFLGALPVILAGLYALLFYPPFKPYRFLGWSIVFTLAAFAFFKAKDYYAIGLYPIYIAFGATYLEHVLEGGWKRYLRPLFIAWAVLCFMPMYALFFPNRPPEYYERHEEKFRKLGLLRWEDGKDHHLPQDFADMLGWRELAHKVDSVYAAFPDPGNVIVICDNYGQAGAVNYYTQKQVAAVSFNADYINWFNLRQSYRHLIRVKDHDEDEDELAKTGPYFEHAVLADSVVNRFARERGARIFVFSGAKIDINQRLKAEIEKQKQRLAD